MITTIRLRATGLGRRRQGRALAACIAMGLLAVASSSAAQDAYAPPAPASTAPAPTGPPPGAWAGWGYAPAASWPPHPANLPKELAYREGMPAPPGYHLETEVRKGLVIAGGTMLGVAYLISIGVAASSDGGEEVMPLYIPVAGPFITMAQFDYDGQWGGLVFTVIGLPLLIDGLVQSAGAVLLVTGVAAQKSYWKRNDLSADLRRPRVRAGLPVLRDAGPPSDHRGATAAPQTFAAGGLTLRAAF